MARPRTVSDELRRARKKADDKRYYQRKKVRMAEEAKRAKQDRWDRLADAFKWSLVRQAYDSFYEHLEGGEDGPRVSRYSGVIHRAHVGGAPGEAQGSGPEEQHQDRGTVQGETEVQEDRRSH